MVNQAFRIKIAYRSKEKEKEEKEEEEEKEENTRDRSVPEGSDNYNLFTPLRSLFSQQEYSLYFFTTSITCLIFHSTTFSNSSE